MPPAPCGASLRRSRAPVPRDLPGSPAEGRFAFGEDELVVGPGSEAAPILLPAAEFDISASESGASVPPTSAERGDETALFDFAPRKDLGVSEPSLAR